MAYETGGDDALTSFARLFIAVFVIALALPTASIASAATASEVPSAVDQYVEMIPTGDGRPTRPGTTTPLPQDSARALETLDRPVATALKEVATSSTFGAPKTRLAPTASAHVSPGLPDASFTGSLKETGGALLNEESPLLGLLAGLAVASAMIALVTRGKNRSAS